MEFKSSPNRIQNIVDHQWTVTKTPPHESALDWACPYVPCEHLHTWTVMHYTKCTEKSMDCAHLWATPYVCAQA